MMINRDINQYTNNYVYHFAKSEEKGLKGFLLREVISRVCAFALPFLHAYYSAKCLLKGVAGMVVSQLRAMNISCFKEEKYNEDSIKNPFVGAIEELGQLFTCTKAILSPVTYVKTYQKIMNDALKKVDNTDQNSEGYRLFPSVTYTFTGGRLGDNLISYIHALWISYKYNMPLLYRTFHLSDKLQLSNLGESFEQERNKFVKQKKIDRNNLGSLDGKEINSSLYISRYFPESPVERSASYNKFNFIVDWNDSKFLELVRKHISSVNPIEPPPIKEGFYNIALHVRTGGGFAYDDGDGKYFFPAKLPPMDYYKEIFTLALSRLKHEEKPLHVHIFTDDKNPKALMEEYQKIAESCDVQVEFSIRDKQTGHNVGELDDLFGIAAFDSILRSDSNFSQISGILGRAKFEISPSHYSLDRNNDELVIDKLRVITRNSDQTTIEEKDINIRKKIIITEKCSMKNAEEYFQWHEDFFSGESPHCGDDL